MESDTSDNNAFHSHHAVPKWNIIEIKLKNWLTFSELVKETSICLFKYNSDWIKND